MPLPTAFAALRAPIVRCALAAGLAALPVSAPRAESAEAGAASGPDVITVMGPAVTAPNRGPIDPFEDAFFAFQGLAFEAAHAFSLASLGAMEQVAAETRLPGRDAPIAVSGPRLAALLAAAGVGEGASVSVVALDGYTIELAPDDRRAHDWIVATHMGGAPLGLGGRGPGWLLYDTGGAEISEEEAARWVWSIVAIRAE